MGYRPVYLDIAKQKGDVVVNPLSSNKTYSIKDVIEENH